MMKGKKPFYGSYGLRMNGTNLSMLDGTLLSQNKQNLYDSKRLATLLKFALRTYPARLGRVLLPNSQASKQKVMKLMLRRYSSCFKAQGRGYKFDNACFLQKQIKYLRYILQLKFKYIL